MPETRVYGEVRGEVRAALALLALMSVLLPSIAAANPDGPVISFGGRRFAVARGYEANESIAFDPVNKHIASRGNILTQCGTLVSAGPTESPGLAWDAVTNSYWQITNDRQVKRWVGNTVVENVFTIPQTFTVPGSGPDTLDAPKGIAVDQNYVYVVDAGPNSGQISSNEWFKFTRTGTPVKSSRSTGLNAHLQMNPDCLFDDILYLPAGTPVYPGRFLIPLEHSGLIIVDAEGSYVGALYWADDPLYALCAPFAFTGMAVDPASGTFYLTENDGTSSQVWTMLPEGSPTSYLVGAGGSQAYLQRPVPGCNLPLWRSLPPGLSGPDLIFGLAYRPADNLVYGYDFNEGSLWNFSPIQGRATLVDATGIPNVWGLAYDTERSVLYASQEVFPNNKIWVVNPADGSATPLPNQVGFYLNDIAFNPTNGAIYGESGGQLIRINRDTGIGTTVGATQGIRGLDYDPATGLLIGMANSPARLWSINPSDGSSTLLAELSSDRGWEGLAVVTLPGQTSDVPELVGGELGTLRVIPNPSTSLVRLERHTTSSKVSPATGGQVNVEAFDSAGRLVRSIYRGPGAVGMTSWTWDGRDEAGRTLPGGTYWVRVQTASGSEVARVVWVR